MFSQPVKNAIGMSFDALTRYSYTNQTGLKIQSTSTEAWLKNAHQLKRSKKLRSFNFDCHDERWFLITKHTSDENSILIFCSEITEH